MKWSQSQLQPMYVINSDTGNTVASLAEFDESGDVNLIYGDVSREEAGRRVRLIAAAPEMYETLELMAEEFRQLDLPYGSKAYLRCQEVLNKVRYELIAGL